MRRLLLSLAVTSTLLSPAALAQDDGEELKTVDIGVVQDADINVVQQLLYPKAGRTELGVHLGWMPFDAYTTTPVAAVTFGSHISETLGWEIAAGGGYGLKNTTMARLQDPPYLTAPDAYRYLASLSAGIEWSPIYAKLNWMGKAVVHHDVYALAGVSGTLEQAILPEHSMAVAPGVGLGVGMRFFLSDKTTLRFQIKDDLMAQYRAKTAESQGWFFKQNAAITAGITFLGKRK